MLLTAVLLVRPGFNYAEQESIRAMWVWGSEEVLNASAQERLLEFAAEKGVNRLYVGAWEALVHQPQSLAKFIQASQRRGIGVELLFGEREWAFARNHHLALEVVDRVLAYGERFPDARPLGIHLDVEPYILPQWKTDKNTVASEMVDLYEKVHARLAGSGLDLVVDIPRWYDEHNIEREGKTRPLHEWVIDVTDGVALMDYQDSYARIKRGAEDELRYASRQNKPVIVGVETLCIEPKSITFCEEGGAFMEGVLRRLHSEMIKSHPSYRGQAIHHFGSYLELQP